jgi:hypothetical protein
LSELAQNYIHTLERIERTKDADKIQQLEEKRGDLHWQLMECLKQHGINVKDREHATRIAYAIVKGRDE